MSRYVPHKHDCFFVHYCTSTSTSASKLHFVIPNPNRTTLEKLNLSHVKRALCQWANWLTGKHHRKQLFMPRLLPESNIEYITHVMQWKCDLVCLMWKLTKQHFNDLYPNVNTLCSGLCYRKSVCCLSASSVTFVRPTQGVETFGNISSRFRTLAILWPPCEFFSEIVLGSLSNGALNERGVAK